MHTFGYPSGTELFGAQIRSLVVTLKRIHVNFKRLEQRQHVCVVTSHGPLGGSPVNIMLLSLLARALFGVDISDASMAFGANSSGALRRLSARSEQALKLKPICSLNA